MNTKEEGAKETAVQIWSAIRLPLITILAYGILHQPIDRLFAKYIANPYLSEVRFVGNAVAQASLFLLSVSGLLYVMWKWSKGFRYALERICWMSATLIFYAFLRFYNTPWLLTDWAHRGGISIKAFDLLFFVLAVQLLSAFYTYAFNSRKTEPNNSEKGFFTDEPKDASEEDNHQRQRYVETIAELLKETNLDNRAFAIGISGVWGSGKTSFMMGLENYLGKDFSHLHFNPWRISRSKDLTEAFFEELSYQISENTDTVADDLTDYMRSITNNQNTNWHSSFLKVLFPRTQWNKSSIEEMHQDINKKLQSLGKKYIVYIDDLDRLDRKEITEVLRIVRNSADFANLIFIVAYDKGQVVNALHKKFGLGSTTYLEKVFQAEFFLPPMIESMVFEDVKEQLMAVIIDIEQKAGSLVSVPENDLFPFHVINFFKQYLENYRDLIRYKNSFKIHYAQVRQEVYLPDFFKILFIRIRYPKVATLIYQRPYEFLTGFDKPSNERFSLVGTHKGPIILRAGEGDRPLTSIKSTLLEYPELYGIRGSDVKKVVELLEDIFSKTADNHTHTRTVPKSEFSVRNVGYFHRYFDENLSNRLSDEQFKQALGQSKKIFLKKVQEWIENRRIGYELIGALERNIAFESIEYLDKILSAFALINDFEDESGNTPYNHLTGVKNIFNEIEDAVHRDSKKYTPSPNYGGMFSKLRDYLYQFLQEDIIYYNFRFQLALAFSNQDENASKVITAESARNLMIDSFRQQVQNLEKITSHVMEAYIFIASIPLNAQIGEIQEIFISLIKKDTDGFIEKIILPSGLNDGAYSIPTWVYELFDGSLEPLQELIKEEVPISPVQIEFLRFSEEMETPLTRRRFIPFDFKEIVVKNG